MARKKTASPTAEPPPKAAPATDDEIRATFVERADMAASEYETAKGRLIKSIETDVAEAVTWTADRAITAQTFAKKWATAVGILNYKERPIGDGFESVVGWTEGTLDTVLQSRSWEPIGASSLANAVKLCVFAADTQALMDIRMWAKIALMRIEGREQEEHRQP